MVEIIQDLLLMEDCVVVPGFGAFVSQYHPAEVSFSDNSVSPPSKSIAFQDTLQIDDGVLINAVAQEYHTSLVEAENMVEEFVRSCRKALFDRKELVFEEIGTLKMDADENILFEADASRNYLPDSFGLENLPLQPIQRLKDNNASQVEVKENYQRILHPELVEDGVTPKRSTLPYWIAAILGIALVASIIGWNIYNSGYLNYTTILQQK